MTGHEYGVIVVAAALVAFLVGFGLAWAITWRIPWSGTVTAYRLGSGAAVALLEAGVLALAWA